MSSSPEQPANLRPKEHGAYAILAIPIVTGLIVAGFTRFGLLITAASVAGFLSHEPLLVSWGHRGQHALRAAPRAASRLWSQLSIAIIAGLAAILSADTPVRIELIGRLLLAMISFATALQGNHRKLTGQLWGVISLSAPGVPILMAGSQDYKKSLLIWIIWLVGFTATIVAVRGVIEKQKRQSRAPLWAILTLATRGAMIRFAGRFDAILAAVSMVGLSWYLMLEPPAPKYLKRVGWTLVAGTLATGTLVTMLF